MSEKNDFVAIGTLAEGTAVIYESGTFNLSTGSIDFTEVKGYVGPRHTNMGGKERVLLMRTKTTGKRLGSLMPTVAVRLR